MAYFDSPKNRAKWERRLAVLREEKIRRQEQGYQPQEQKEAVMEVNDNPFRKKINFKQLEEIERKSMEAARVRRPGRAARREMDGARREMDGMKKSGMEKKGMAR